MPKHIGIVGCSAEGAALCYKTVCVEGSKALGQALPYVLPRSPLPWLHIAEVVAEQAAARGFSRLGLTGTRWLVESEVYPEKLATYGLEYVRLNDSNSPLPTLDSTCLLAQAALRRATLESVALT